MTTCRSNPPVPPLICTGCGMKFGGVSGFDAHRIGIYVDEHPHYGRHCKTREEMESMGYVEKNGKMILPMSDEDLAKFRAMKQRAKNE